jgi:hypothetical protein
MTSHLSVQTPQRRLEPKSRLIRVVFTYISFDVMKKSADIEMKPDLESRPKSFASLCIKLIAA